MTEPTRANAANRPRLSWTNRARIMLVLAPVLLPLTLLLSAVYALGPAAKAWWWHAAFRDELCDWYRLVYRVAR